jgi:hypothetical protein
MSDTRQAVITEVLANDPTAKDIRPRQVIEDIDGNSVWYVTFESTENPPPDNFFYVMVRSNGATKLFDDGVTAMDALAVILDQRHAATQRLKDFWFVEIVAAVLALVFVIAFFASTFWGSNGPNQHLAGIVAIIMGYYFGKNVKKG